MGIVLSKIIITRSAEKATVGQNSWNGDQRDVKKKEWNGVTRRINTGTTLSTGNTRK